MREISKADIKALAETIWSSKLPLHYKMELFGGLQHLYKDYDKYTNSEVRDIIGLIRDRLRWIKKYDPEVVIGQAIWDLIDLILVPLKGAAWILTHLKEIVVFMLIAAVVAGVTYAVIKIRKAVK